MTDIYKAARQALEALEVCEVHGYIPVRLTCQAVTALRQAIEQAEKQEPVGYMDKTKFKLLSEGDSVITTITSHRPFTDDVPLYATPPAAQREWVGLTDEEILDMWPSETRIEFVRAIEAKLKEKNT